ncbi:MAG TPA: ABC transporter permease [Gemmatimonadaceae bacterium]|nr:ABC transporter permease [Gemmatimonadaceae bacterium]
MSESPRRDPGERLFRALLVVYPRAFRSRFGEEMVEFFRERRLEQHRNGFRGAARLWAHLVADITINAPLMYLHAMAARTHDLQPATSRDVPWSSPEYPAETRPMETLLLDIRFAARTLLRRPAFAAVAALTLALGIGATTAIYSVVNAVLVQPLPWPEADRIVLATGLREGQQAGVVYLDYLDWKARNRTFSELAALRGQSVNLTGREVPERLFGTFATANLFRMLGVVPAQGRLFTDAETEVATRQPVAVVSHSFWSSHLGGAADALGKTVVLNGQPFVVVGVLPAGFKGPQGTPDVWMPIGYYPNSGELETRGRPGVAVAGLLKPGATVAQAEADLNTIAASLATTFPETNAGLTVGVSDLREQLVGSSRAQLYMVLVAVSLVLLIACANVANLQLTRAASRRRELTVRSALGAGRGRLVRQLVTESLILSLAGGMLGVAIAWAGVRWLSAVVPNYLTVMGTVELNGQVLAFAMAVTIGTGLVFALPPAVRASRVQLNDALTVRSAAAGRGMRGSPLVFAQMTLCVVLLVTAGLLGRSLVALSRVNPGFDPSNVLTMQFRLPPTKYDTEEKIAATFDRMLAELRAVPGVTGAAFVRATPLNGNGGMEPYQLDGAAAADRRRLPMLNLNLVTPGYFETMRIPRIAGRDFSATDRIGSQPVVIVNAQLADRIAPEGTALGKRLQMADGDELKWFTVVGVVGNTRHFSVGEAQLAQAYLPIAQVPLIFTEVVARATGSPESIASAARAAIWRVDRDQPVWRVRPLSQSIGDGLGSRQFILRLLAGFTILAVLLAMIGIYGVTGYAVAGRTQEMGIRMALGARAGQVVRLVVRQSMKTVFAAIVVGLGVSLVASKYIEAQLFGVRATDPLTYLLVPAGLAFIALLASWLPARRASAIDPIQTLRGD